MIFKEIIKQKETIIRQGVTDLFQLALKNQSHSGDLLLIYINGFHDHENSSWYKTQPHNLNPHVIGLGKEGWSEHTHYEFIDWYRKHHLCPVTLEEYKEELKWSEEKNERIQMLIKGEALTIQQEMLIYLKIWEADSIMKRFYQLARLTNQESYDWYFRLPKSIHEKSDYNRQDIWRLQIRDRLQQFSMPFYNTIKNGYISQIRNSIAHSNYSIIDRNIHLNNFVEGEAHNKRKVVEFDEWIDVFHNTIMLFNEYIGLKNMIHRHYETIALKGNLTIPVRITEKDGKQYELPIEYRPEFQDWGYKNS